MQIQKVTDASFRAYGKVLEGYDFSRLLKGMEHTPLPADDVIYVPSVEELEALPVAEELKNRGFGGLPIEIGYCNGNNKKTECAGVSPLIGDQRGCDRRHSAHRKAAGCGAGSHL